MDFNKNQELIQNICLVQLKSVDAVVDLNELTQIYFTPSKIKLTGTTKHTESGVLVTKRLRLNYPGISATDFNKFHNLTRGAFQVFIKTTENNIYEIASDAFFMTCSIVLDNLKHHVLNFYNSSPIPIKFIDNQPESGINTDGFDYDFKFYLS